jgi:lipopolysaccharide heptosyltransferase I
MRILIVKTSSLGDLFHALPTVHLLKQEYHASIDWVVNQEYVQLVECFTDVDKVISFPRQTLKEDYPSFVKALREEPYDMIVDLQGLAKSALLICKAAKRIKEAKILGPSFQREGARLFYTAVVGKKNKDRHAVEENLDVMTWLTRPVEPVLFPVEFPPVDRPCMKKNPVVVFAPCSRHEAKNWPAERFVELGEQLRTQIVLVGSQEDEDVCLKIENALPEGAATNLCGKTSLVELGGILQAANLVITVDSGPMHMASAIGTPCLAIFGPTDPKRVGPYGPQHRVIRNATTRYYSKEDMDSIRQVGVEEVLETAKEMLGHEAPGL